MKSKLLFLAVSLGIAASAASRSAHADDTKFNLDTRDTWQWYQDDVNQPMYCLGVDQNNNQTKTGFGYYVPSNWNGYVMFVLDGGGFCYDHKSCVENATLNNNPLGSAVLFSEFEANGHADTSLGPPVFRNTYSKADFINDTTKTGVSTVNLDSLASPVLSDGIMDSQNASANPFVHYMKVFVPYCTGDNHAGFRTDNSAAVSGRIPSGRTFYGLYDTYVAFETALGTFKKAYGRMPQKVVLAGGSAGGFGAEMTYGLLRVVVGSPGDGASGTSILVIDDGGTPFFSGASTNGTTWTSQGYFQKTGDSIQTVSSMEEMWFDAWGPQWTAYFPSNLSNGQPVISSPLGAGHRPFAPLQALVASNIATAAQSSTFNSNDKFYVMDGTSDWMWAFFLPMYQTARTPVGGTPMINAYNQIASVLPSSAFFEITSTSLSNLTPNVGPWYEHHTFIGNNVSSWSIAHGSGVSSVWNKLCAISTGAWAGSCDPNYVTQN